MLIIHLKWRLPTNLKIYKNKRKLQNVKYKNSKIKLKQKKTVNYII